MGSTTCISRGAVKRPASTLPFRASSARSGRKAYLATLKLTGAVVVKTSQGHIVERRSDGSSVLIKEMPLGKRVKPGIVLKRDKPAA